MAAREPDEHDPAYDICAEHFVIAWSLHPDAKSSLAAAIRTAVEEWLEDNSEEYRNNMGEP